jgi:hypothetical protein
LQAKSAFLFGMKRRLSSRPLQEELARLATNLVRHRRDLLEIRRL